jgi:predicted small integral membrane protein
MTKTLRVAALAFGCLALVAGGLQLWAYATTGGPRHLILGTFALAVGVSVISSVVVALRTK